MAVPGKVLADAGHAAGAQPVVQRRSEVRDGIRVAVKRAVADDGAGAMIEIEHRSEAEIDAMRAELVRHRAPEPRRLARGAGHVAVPDFAQRAHRRYRA